MNNDLSIIPVTKAKDTNDTKLRSDLDLNNDLTDELRLASCAAGLVSILGGNDDHIAGQQQDGAAHSGLLVELQVVLGVILFQDQALALADAELLFAGDDILDVEELIVSLEGAFACGELYLVA